MQPPKSNRELECQINELKSRIEDLLPHIKIGRGYKPCDQCRAPCLQRCEVCFNCYGMSYFYGDKRLGERYDRQN